MAASVEFTYNGTNSLTAICAGLTPATLYDLVIDGASAGDSQTSDGSGNVTLAAVDVTGFSTGDRFKAYIVNDAGAAVFESVIILKYGTAYTPGTVDESIGCAWSYDGGDLSVGYPPGGLITATFTGQIGTTYKVYANHGTGFGSGGTGVPGDGGTDVADSPYITVSTAFPTILCVLGDASQNPFAAAIFTTGVAGAGTNGQAPVGGGAGLLSPEGVCIAFDNAPFDESPAWIRIDNTTGTNVETINIKRGRPDERSKSAVGTATISGNDTVGAVDPTNTGSPYYSGGATKLDPVKPAAVALWNPVDADWNTIFTGYTADYTLDLDVSEKKLDFEIDLVDMLDMLNDAEVVPDQAGNTVPAESTGDCFYTGQHVDDRLRAVLADSATAFLASVWPADWMNIFTGNVNVQGRIYAARTTLLQIIDEACDAEFPGVSNRFIGKDGVFDFRGRYARYNADTYMAGSGNAGTARVAGSTPGLHWYVGDLPAAALDSTLAVYTGLKFTRGKANLINAALVTPIGIAPTDVAGQFVYDATSVGKFGPRTSGMSLENLTTGNSNDDGLDALAETKAFGQGTVDNYKNPLNRISQLVFQNPPAGATAGRATSTWRLLCGIELSDLITVTSTHPGGGGFAAVDFFVEGITYDLAPLRGDEWKVTLTLDVSPRAYYATNPFPHS